MTKQVYNKVFTKEKWENINNFNKGLLDDYMLQIKSEGKTEGSMRQYFNDARIILIYIMEEQKNKELYKLTSKSFRNFKIWCGDNDMSPARTNRLLVTVRNLMNFGLEDEEFEDDFEDCKVNPSRLKGLQKEEVRDIIFLTDEEIECIYNKLVEEKEYSKALYCSLMYDSACRRNEAFQVTFEDITEEERFTKNEVIGKRKKKFKLLYNERTLEAYRLLCNSTDNRESLWLTISGKPASYETLYNWVVEWRLILKEEMGIEKEFNPHSFRHSALTNLNDGTHYIARKMGKKFELNELKLLANHENIATTESYIENRDGEKLLAAFGA